MRYHVCTTGIINVNFRSKHSHYHENFICDKDNKNAKRNFAIIGGAILVGYCIYKKTGK